MWKNYVYCEKLLELYKMYVTLYLCNINDDNFNNFFFFLLGNLSIEKRTISFFIYLLIVVWQTYAVYTSR